MTLSGPDAAQFEFVPFIDEPDSISGDLNFIAPVESDIPLDADGDNVYDLTVELSDGVNLTTQDITITVDTGFMEEFGAPTIPTLEVSSGFAFENDTFTDVFIFADDEDFDVLTVSLSGTDAALFSLTGSTVDTAPFADIIFNTAPDFENPLDADGDNIFELTVELTDGVNVVTQDITITLEDDPFDDAPDEGNSAKPDSAEAGLASFAVDTDGLIDLNETASEGVSLSDIEAVDFMPESSVYVEDGISLITAEASAEDMQFAADLLLLQDAATEIDA